MRNCVNWYGLKLRLKVVEPGARAREHVVDVVGVRGVVVDLEIHGPVRAAVDLLARRVARREIREEVERCACAPMLYSK